MKNTGDFWSVELLLTSTMALSEVSTPILKSVPGTLLLMVAGSIQRGTQNSSKLERASCSCNRHSRAWGTQHRRVRPAGGGAANAPASPRILPGRAVRVTGAVASHWPRGGMRAGLTAPVLGHWPQYWFPQAGGTVGQVRVQTQRRCYREARRCSSLVQANILLSSAAQFCTICRLLIGLEMQIKY